MVQGERLCCRLPGHLYPAHAPLQNVLQLTAPLLPFFTLLGATPADRRRAIRRKLFDRRLALQLQNRELQHHRLAVFAESTSTSSPPPTHNQEPPECSAPAGWAAHIWGPLELVKAKAWLQSAAGSRHRSSVICCPPPIECMARQALATAHMPTKPSNAHNS